MGEETPMEVDQQSTAPSAQTSSTLRVVDGIPVYEEVAVPPPPEAIQSFDGSGPRLMITHIVNENFKSYAGQQTLGPFHKSFSAIVGPNGSGKSNVIDSMLFVFGYRANKIRSKKISVLIHNSEDHKNLTSCSVAVHFQKIIDTGEGDDDYDTVPNSKFVVSRTAFKDNSSYYKLNDKKATYKEVAIVLRGSGIDLDHNRFLILQGEVEQIAMMKPKAQSEHEDGMLEFLEDIIGSSRYKEPIDVLTKRVEELNELRGEKLNRVKAVEKEKDDLEGVKNEAVEYLSMENDITRKKNSLYQKYICGCEENRDKAQKKCDEVKESRENITKKLTEINENKKEKHKEKKKIYKQYEDLSKKCDESKEKFSEYEQRDVRLREDLKHAKGKIKKLEKSLEQEQKKLEELRQIPEKTERDTEDLKKKLAKLDADKEKEEVKLKEVMDSLKTETQGLQGEKDGKEKELMDLQKVVNETKSKYTVAQSEHSLYLSALNSETSKLKDTQRNLDNMTKTLVDRKNGLKDMENRTPQIETALGKAKSDLQQLAQTESDISESVRQTRVRVEEARSSLQSSSSRGKVLEGLMALKRRGNLPGIYGRLGDLGAIDEKYDVAISTACGALDHIIVDSINTGQKCVEFLKKNKVGLATFVGLDKMAKWKGHCERKIQTPENVPRLFDLVKVEDQEVLPAFYFALRDTLVAKDLDQATRIAYGKTRYRVVTLDGQLIDQSGTMSGGGGKVCKGRMGSSVVVEVDPKELQAMEAKLEKEAHEMQSCRDNKHKLDMMVEKLQREYNDLKYGIEKFTMEIASMNEQEKSLQKQVKEQEVRAKEAAPDEKQLKQLEKSVDGFKKLFDEAKENANEIEEQVHQLHKQIMDIGGTKLKAAESRVNLVQTQIDQVTGLITKANVAIKTAQRNAKKSEDKVTSLEEETKENKENIEKLETECKEVEVEATKVLEAYQSAQEAMKEVSAAVEEIKTEVAKIEEEEQKYNKDQIEIDHEMEKYETVVKENQSKARHWKKELGKLSVHVLEGIDNEELPTIEVEVLKELNKEDTQYEITVLEEKLAQMKPNMAAIAEYKKKEELYLKRVSELDQITDIRDSQRKLHETLRKQRLDEFMSGFSVITNKLKEMYQMITLGGDAELELVDSLDPFSEGIVFSVRPPKKSWKNISNLSGGEKTLSSLALVFALHHYKPTPLYVMDEIDAALDFKNVSIVANYIKERTKNAQFIIISLRNNMFELADRLIGIYKTYNATKSVTINPKKISIPLADLDSNTVAVN